MWIYRWFKMCLAVRRYTCVGTHISCSSSSTLCVRSPLIINGACALLKNLLKSLMGNQALQEAIPLQWRHNGWDSVSNHQPPDCLLNRLFRHRFKENIKAPCHWPLCGEFTGDRGIPRTKGQLRGKCFHLMTSPCLSTGIHMGPDSMWKCNLTRIWNPIVYIRRS